MLNLYKLLFKFERYQYFFVGGGLLWALSISMRWHQDLYVASGKWLRLVTQLGVSSKARSASFA